MKKYKLINKKSCYKNGVLREGESCRFNNNCIYPNCCETICDKVTIDGFDYYVSDEIQLGANNVWVATKSRVFKFEIHMAVVKSNMPRIVIATNNPNIDIPKVVDEVEKVGSVAIQNSKKFSNSSETDYTIGFIHGYNKSQETHPFSEEDVRFMLSESFKASQEGYQITSNEIIQLWKEQKPKIVYYE